MSSKVLEKNLFTTKSVNLHLHEVYFSSMEKYGGGGGTVFFDRIANFTDMNNLIVQRLGTI